MEKKNLIILLVVIILIAVSAYVYLTFLSPAAKLQKLTTDNAQAAVEKTAANMQVVAAAVQSLSESQKAKVADLANRAKIDLHLPGIALLEYRSHDMGIYDGIMALSDAEFIYFATTSYPFINATSFAQDLNKAGGWGKLKLYSKNRGWTEAKALAIVGSINVRLTSLG